MGTFFHPITLIGPTGASETMEALVDTGASFTTVPASVLERLGVRPHRSMRFRLADGRLADWPLGWVTVEIDGQREQSIAAFGPEDSPPLLGVHTLESMGLGVDPVEHRLVPREGFLMAVDPVEQKLVPKEAYLM